jgi:hypothetical protein
MEEVLPHIIWWQIWDLYQRIIIITNISQIQEHKVKETLKRNVETLKGDTSYWSSIWFYVWEVDHESNPFTATCDGSIPDR